MAEVAALKQRLEELQSSATNAVPDASAAGAEPPEPSAASSEDAAMQASICRAQAHTLLSATQIVRPRRCNHQRAHKVLL